MFGRACVSSKTTLRHTISTAGWSARPPSNCPATCRSAITGCTLTGRRSTKRHAADRHPGVARPARAARRRRTGVWPPSSTACGRERSWGVGDLDRPRPTSRCGPAPSTAPASCWSTRCTPPRRSPPMEPSPYLPTSRRFVNPLYLRVEAIPEFAELAPPRPASASSARAAGDGARRPTSSTATRRGRPSAPRSRASYRVERSAGPRTRLRRPTASARAQPRRLRDLVCAGRAARPRLASTGRRSCSTRPSPAVAEFAAEHADDVDFHRWLQWQLDDQLAAAQADGRGGRHGARHHARPRRRGGPERRRRLGDAGRARARRHRGRAARRVQPARAGLVAAAVASRPARRAGLRAVSGAWSTRCCGTRAAFASTTSSGCSGCGGSRRARRPPRAPTCATTTRR